MVKGVHKKIIEVKHPGGDYFEKAVFYLRPGVTQLPPEIAEAAARMILEEIQPSGRRLPWRKIVSALAAAAIITAIAVCAVLMR